jgi:hypothetical protein
MEIKFKYVLIIVAVIIIIILFFTLFGNNGKKTNIDCNTACRNIANKGWTFPGAKPLGVYFFTQEECTTSCKKIFKR